MPKILMLAGDAAESLEVMYPYQRLLEEGYEVDIAAPTKKKLQFVVHDFVEGFDTYTEKLGYTWDADLAFEDVDPSDYVALVVPGGRAPEYIRNHPECQRIVRHFFDGSKPVAQICHAPLALAAAGVLEGQEDRGLPGARPGRRRGRCGVRRRRRGGRRPDGLGASVAGSPDVDAGVHEAAAPDGAGPGLRREAPGASGEPSSRGPALARRTDETGARASVPARGES